MREDATASAQRALQLERQGDVAGAIREFEAATAADPGQIAAHVNLIALYGRQQDWARAGAHYDAVIAAGGTVPAEAHYNFGVCLAAQRQLDRAEALFRKATEVNPQYANAWSGLGQLAEGRGRIEEAEADYRRAVEHAPGDNAAHFNIARMLLARKAWTEAIAELTPLAERDLPERPRYLFGLATAYVLSGDVATGRRLSVQARDLAREKGQTALATAIEGELARLPKE